jgi:hypothetical protein
VRPTLREARAHKVVIARDIHGMILADMVSVGAESQGNNAAGQEVTYALENRRRTGCRVWCYIPFKRPVRLASRAGGPGTIYGPRCRVRLHQPEARSAARLG